jgi:aryl-alcohol dehydrogenase-like predicted oxidoreductase
VIVTKAWVPPGESRSAADRAVKSLDDSLRQLGTDYIDIFQLHSVSPRAYDEARDIIAPALLGNERRVRSDFLE